MTVSQASSQADFGQMYLSAETSGDQVCYYFSQTDLWSDIPPMIRLWVRLTFSQTSSQVDLWTDVSPVDEASGQVDIFDRSLGQADLWSDGLPIGEALDQVDI